MAVRYVALYHRPKFLRYRVADRGLRATINAYRSPHGTARIGFAVVVGSYAYCVKWAKAVPKRCGGDGTNPSPWVGEESDEHRAVCVYSARPGQPPCGAPAIVHVQSIAPRYGYVVLASCAAHAPIARSAGQFVMEHRYEGVCGFPSTIWDDTANRCVLDATGEEPALRGAAQPSKTTKGRP